MGNTHIALLRGINVSGQKKIKMADLRQILEENGLKNVKTYIQSGNIIFDSEPVDRSALQEKIAIIIRQQFGFDVPTLVLRKNDVEHILKSNPYLEEADESKLYYVLMKNTPEEVLAQQFSQLQFKNEGFKITDTCVYLFCKSGYGKAKLNNNLIENKLKVKATTRNHKTMLKLLELVSD